MELDIPQGVLVVTCPPDDIDNSIRRYFLQPGIGFAQALAQVPNSVRGMGFVSNLSSLIDAPSNSFPSPAAEEQGFWRAVSEIGTKEALEIYLRAYPNGAHAGIARGQLDAINSRSPEQEAADHEASLALSREDRRKVQENLSLLGYDTNGIDGIFGRGTRNAIANWQRDYGYNPIGYLTSAQISRLSGLARDKASELAAEARRKQIEMEAEDRSYWISSGAAAGDERGLRRYLRRYPDGLYSAVAEARLDAIRQANQGRITRQERNAWRAAEEAGTIEAYEGYLANYPDGAFADDANAKIEELREQAARQAEIDAARLEEESLNMNILARILVEKQLIQLGLEPGLPDGNFDDWTRRALRKFQRTRGFPVTGYLTRQTLVRLIAEAGGG